MRNYKQFINEGNAMDFLKGKSIDQMKIAFDEVVKKFKINYIIDNRLPNELLPRDENGRCIVDEINKINSKYDHYDLPDDMTTRHFAVYGKNKLTRLPKGLIVNGNLDIHIYSLIEWPDDTIVTGDINIGSNELIELPKWIKNVNGFLWVNINNLIKLPDNLTVNGDLNCSNNELTELPKGLKVKGNLVCYDNKVEFLELPEDAQVDGRFVNDTDYRRRKYNKNGIVIKSRKKK